MPAGARGTKIMLCVPVVVTEAWCWVNGHYAGHRSYQEAYVRPAEMELDVTEFIRAGQANLIVIRVDTSLSAEQAAEGIQSRALSTPNPDSERRCPSRSLLLGPVSDHKNGDAELDWDRPSPISSPVQAERFRRPVP